MAKPLNVLRYLIVLIADVILIWLFVRWDIGLFFYLAAIALCLAYGIFDTDSDVTKNKDEATLRLKIEELSALVINLKNNAEALRNLAIDKSNQVDSLSAKLKDRKDLRILQRIAQFQHTLEFNRFMLSNGKMDLATALEEIERELESTLYDLGIKTYSIKVGMLVRDLPSNSFELLNALSPSSPELSGTVKTVRQSALTYTDNEGKMHFIIPAKIDAYKLS